MMLSFSIALYGQCTLTISSYPYNESFESGQGGWNAGGAFSDWTWGTPTKPVINSAGSGTKCWIIGGLTTSFYNNDERSWVQSPCFDFSSLTYPYISFKIFWDSEFHFDGGNFQSSIDGGNTWQNAGGYNDPVNCNNAHWFNHTPITYLNGLAAVRDGWSGSGTSGSGGWVLAKHCLSYLAGEPNVIFRFTFGAGHLLNNYDGLAFDDITIAETPALIPAFSFSCRGTNTIGFTDHTTTCPNFWSWNFNDPGSGNGNLSTAQNPVHTFSGPGSYLVTLSALNGCSAAPLVSHPVSVISAAAASTDVSCFGGNNGSATIHVEGGGSSYLYHWNTNPVQSDSTATGLPQGIFTFVVTGNNVCPDTNSVTINEPPGQVIDLGGDSTICPGNELKIFAGNFMSYRWQDSSQASTLVIHDPGIYYVTVTNSSGCSTSDTISFKEECLADVIAPNAFTPDGDGVNDLFFASGLNVTSFNMKIYNRWGEVIFESDDINVPWNGYHKGKVLESDIFVWLIRFSINDRAIEEKVGSVLLVR